MSGVEIYGRREDDEEEELQLALALSLSEAESNEEANNQPLLFELQDDGGSHENQHQQNLDTENQEVLLLAMALSMLETEDTDNEDQGSFQPVSTSQPDTGRDHPRVISPCVICLDQQSEVTFVPCGHLCSCVRCSEYLDSSRCPLCRTNIEQKIRIILP